MTPVGNNVTLPPDIQREVNEQAAALGINGIELLRRSVKLGLVAARVEVAKHGLDPTAAILVREHDELREIEFGANIR